MDTTLRDPATPHVESSAKAIERLARTVARLVTKRRKLNDALVTTDHELRTARQFLRDEIAAAAPALSLDANTEPLSVGRE